MQPVREVEEAVVHRDDHVGDQPGHATGQRPALELLVLDLDHGLGLEAAVRAVEADDVAGQGRPDEALVCLGVVQPAHLEGDEAGLAEVQGLLEPPLREVPEVQPLPVAARADVLDVEAGLVGVRLAELRRDERVLARLVPEVVVQLGLGPPFSQRPLTSKVRASRTAKPPDPPPSSSPSMLTTTLSPGMQWTVWGRV